MEIKIKKSKFSLNWYYDKVGETFEVAKIDKKEKVYEIFGGPCVVSWVGFDDAEILNVEDLKRTKKSFCECKFPSGSWSCLKCNKLIKGKYNK